MHANPELAKRGVVEAQGLEGDAVKKGKLGDHHPFEVVFGLPWTWGHICGKGGEVAASFLVGEWGANGTSAGN